MTTTVVDRPQVAPKNMSAWIKSGVAVTATSASDVSRQAGLDWTVSLHDVTTTYQIPGQGQPVHIPVKNKQAVVKTTPTGEVIPLGIVGTKYKPFQNAEVFSVLDTLIDSGDARYAAAGEYDAGAKVWMLLQLPNEITVANDPHAAFILAKTSHDGSSSVVIKPIIERLFCKNQINKLYRNNNKYTYTLKHTSNSKLKIEEVRHIMQMSYDVAEEYSGIANKLISKEITRAQALDYFKKIFPLPPIIENTPHHLLTQGEKSQLSRAITARDTALAIFTDSPTQENIRNTEFGLWQSIIEYADHGKKDKGTTTGVRAMSGGSDNLKIRALELLTV